VTLSIAVQHHPSRAELLPLLEHLGEYELVVDPEPDAPYQSAMRTYLEALRRTPGHATHRLIVQDDAVACTGFPELAEAAVAEHPDDLVAFFVPGRTLLRNLLGGALARGERWCQLPQSLNWTPTVALCWPAGLIDEFVAFGEEVIATRARRGLSTQADDPYVGAWRKKRKLPVWATVPCLVQHPDVAQSLYHKGLKPRAGANRSRVAAMYVDALASATAGDSAGAQRGGS
jgi:hypothetical protein